jgi:hypothetical protein
VHNLPNGQVHVAFGPEFYDVNARYPRRRNASTGGGSGGGTYECHEEYVIVEINYGDGTGWHVLWEGNAMVCE